MILEFLYGRALGLAFATPNLHITRAAPSAHRVAATQWEVRAEWLVFAVVDIGLLALAVSFAMCLWRFLRGPTLVDRGLAADTVAMQLVGMTILLTIRLRTLLFFDAVLIISILGFATTVAFAQFIGRRRAV